MNPDLLIQIANFYKTQEWQGRIRNVVNGKFLRKHYRVNYNDHSYLLVGTDTCNNNSVWLAYHDKEGKKLECKAVLFQ